MNAAVLMLSLLLLPFGLQAQQKGTGAPLKLKQDSVPLWRGLQIKVDGVGAVQSLTGQKGQWEAGLRINLRDRYFPTIEAGLGHADIHDEATLTHYTTRAPYGKVGVDFNVMKNKHDIYRIYAGLRYAYTSFSMDVDRPAVVDAEGTTTTEALHATGVKARWGWMEAVFALDAKVWGPLHIGWSARYKRRLHQREEQDELVNYVPGYGTAGVVALGGTFDIILEL